MDTISAISVFIILASPWIPKFMNMTVLENILARLLLVFFVAYAIRQGAMPGLLSFLAVFSLITERNLLVLTSFPHQAPKFPLTAGIEGPPSYTTPLTPVESNHSYEPPHADHDHSIVEKQGGTTVEKLYEDASDLQDSNPRVDDIAQGEAAASFFEQKGLA